MSDTQTTTKKTIGSTAGTGASLLIQYSYNNMMNKGLCGAFWPDHLEYYAAFVGWGFAHVNNS